MRCLFYYSILTNNVTKFLFEDLVSNDLMLQTKPGQLRVILLAYMHTGSTYLGSILQNHPGTFYLFEPLRSFLSICENKKPLNFLNGSTRYVCEVFLEVGILYVFYLYTITCIATNKVRRQR